MDPNVLVQPLLEAVGDFGNVYAALAVVVLTTVLLFFIIRSSKSGQDTVLLLGLCDSGKTLLYSLLTSRKAVKTQTSIQANIGRYVSTGEKGGKAFRIVDLPGHERVRSKYLYEHKDSARGIIFLVDSVNFSRELRDVADFMYDVLANKTIMKNKTSILVACNKQDQDMAKSSQVVKSQLEKELNTLRHTRSATLLTIDDSASSKNAFIGKKGNDFEFTQMHPIKVEFCECSLTSSEDKPVLNEVEAWLHKL